MAPETPSVHCPKCGQNIPLNGIGGERTTVSHNCTAGIIGKVYGFDCEETSGCASTGMAPESERASIEAKIRAAAKQQGLSPRVKTLAKFINEKLPDLEATIDTTWVDTSRQVPGHRYVYAHTGRQSNRIQVVNRKTREKVFTHVATETYRHNYEVCSWIVKQLANQSMRQRIRLKVRDEVTHD